MSHQPLASGDGRPVFGWAAWLVLGVLLAHMAEEWPRFPEWATAHFGTTTPRWYALSHLPIVALVAWISGRAAALAPSRAAAYWLILAASAFLANTVFHAVTTLALGEYSPGLLTSVLYLPVLLLLGSRARARFGAGLVLKAGVAGVLASVLVTATLWLDVPV